MHPVVLVILLSVVAAAFGALGSLPLVRRWEVHVPLGWASALAAGMMLGAAYLVADSTAREGSVGLGLGAFAGIALTHACSYGFIRRDTGIDLDSVEVRATRQLLLEEGVHSAAEGVAIGAAMGADSALGLFMATAIAVHNVPEGIVLSAMLRARSVGLPKAGLLSALVNVGQVVLSAVTLLVALSFPATLPLLQGVAVGALIHLVMAQLLPQSYRTAGSTSIAVVASVAIGIVVLLRGLVGP